MIYKQDERKKRTRHAQNSKGGKWKRGGWVGRGGTKGFSKEVKKNRDGESGLLLGEKRGDERLGTGGKKSTREIRKVAEGGLISGKWGRKELAQVHMKGAEKETSAKTGTGENRAETVSRTGEG